MVDKLTIELSRFKI